MLGRAAGWLLTGGALLYAGGLIVLAALWSAFPQRTWWLEVSNIFAIGLFVPLPVVLLAALLRRSRGLRAAAAAALAVFLMQYGARLIPPVPPQEAGRELRVVTLNQLYRNLNLEALVAAIRAQRPDVVAIQELSRPVAATLREELGEEYPYQLLAPSPTDVGLGLISRYPFRERSYSLGFKGQRVVLDVDGTPVTVLNVHLASPSFRFEHIDLLGPRPIIADYRPLVRAREEPRLLRAIDSYDGPLIVLGDFNTSDREPFYRALASRLTDAYATVAWGLGYTFPNKVRAEQLPIPFPVVRIDYVWSRSGVEPVAAWVDCETAGSDHCLVGAALRVSAPLAGAGDGRLSANSLYPR